MDKKITTSNGHGSSTQTTFSSSVRGTFYQVIEGKDGYVAIGNAKGASGIYEALIAAFDDNGNFLNNTPTLIDLPTTLGSTFSSIANAYTITGALDPTLNSISKIIIGGSTGAIENSTGQPFTPAFVCKVNYTAGMMQVPPGTGNLFIRGRNNGHNEENRFAKIVTRSNGSGGYNLYACGYKSAGTDNVSQFLVNLGSFTQVHTFDKDIWAIGLNDDFSTLIFENTFNKSALNPIVFTDMGHLTARNIDPGTGNIRCLDVLGSSPLLSPATVPLNANNNKDERGTDIILTNDGNLALTGVVNNIMLNGNVNGVNIISPTMSCIGADAGDHYEEYVDQDAYLIKISSSGTMLENKNVGHFSGSDFRIRVIQDHFNRYIIAGSTADNYGNILPNLPDQLDAHAENEFIVCTQDGSSDLWRRSFVGFDTRQTHGEDCLCGFGLCLTADDGYVISGNNDNNGDDFSVTKFAPIEQEQFVGIGFYEKFGNTFIPDIYTITGSETWNTSKLIASKIVIKPGGKLTISNTSIFFAASDHMWDYFNFPSQGAGGNQGVGIYVEPGGKLIIDKSSLQQIDYLGLLGGTVDDRSMWDGIVLHGIPTSRGYVNVQGYVEINGGSANSSIIQGARYGIYAADNYRGFEEEDNVVTTALGTCGGSTTSSRYNGYATMGGGIVYANNAVFQNCRNGVNFQNCPAHSNISYFNNSIFTCDAKGMGDICFYTNAAGDLQSTNAYVADWNVHGISLRDNVFNCDASFAPAVRPAGIVGADAGMNITRTCTSTYYGGGCTYTGPGNKFSNLSVATSFAFSPTTSYSVQLSHNTFDNCGYGVRVDGSVHGLVVKENNFLTPGIWTLFGTSPLAYPTHVGALLTGCHGYDVSQNIFDKCSSCSTFLSWAGTEDLLVNNNQPNNDLVNLNTFKNTWTGSFAMGNNGNGDHGLQFHCNTYNSIYSIGRVSVSTTGGGTSSGTLRNPQGNCLGTNPTAPAGNQFNIACSAGSALQTHLYDDPAVTQNVIYINNQSATVFDPGSSADCTHSLYTDVTCGVTGATTSNSCPIPGDYLLGDGTTSMGAGTKAALDELPTLDQAMAVTTDPDDLAALQAQHDYDISFVVRYYNMVEDYASAGDLLVSYGLYADALPFYSQAGMYTEANNALAKLPQNSNDDVLFAYLASLGVDLASNGQTWQDLDDQTKTSISAIPQFWSQPGTMAGTISEITGTGSILWPMYQLSDSLVNVISADSSYYNDSTMGGNDSIAHKDGRAIQAVNSNSSTAALAFSLFPNPNYGNFTILSSQAGNFKLFTLDGRIVSEYTVNTGKSEQQLPLSLTPGIYLGVFKPADGGAEKVIRLVYQP